MMAAAISIAREVQESYLAEARPLSAEGAHERLVSIARRRAADDVAMLEPLLIAHDSRVHEVLGLASFQEYCGRLFGWGGRATRERVRVARAMRELPEMRARWAAGELTYSVVRELTRVATPTVEREWLTWASEGGVRRTVREVERKVARHTEGSRPSDPPAALEERTVSVVLRMSGSEAARYSEVRAEAVRRLGRSVDDETLAKMLFDAFLHGAPAERDESRAPNQVHLVVCERCSETERQAGAEGSVRVHPKVGEAALCDAQVVRRGERAVQSVPPARRRAVLQRDEGKCAVPGCRHAAYVEVHHVERRADGGDHDLENLVSLCSVHHDAAHRGRLVLRRVDGELAFERGDGMAYGSLLGGSAIASCAQAEHHFQSIVAKTGSEVRARVEIDRHRDGETAHAGQHQRADDAGRESQDDSARAAPHVGQRAPGGHALDDARPAIPQGLVEQVAQLLTGMGYRAADSRRFVASAIAGGELRADRAPTAVELLRASLRAAPLPGTKRS
jgi:hypothetical protein